MKNKSLVFGLLFISAMLMAQTAPQRVPARRGIFAVVQPNGDTLHIQLVGDEWWHVNLTADGYVIKKDKRDYWCYARWGRTYTDKRGNTRRQVNATCRIAQDADRRSACTQRWLSRHGTKLHNETAQRCPRRIVPGDPRTPNIDSLIALDREERLTSIRRGIMSTPGIGRLTLTPRVLVIMANFADYTFTTTKAQVDSLFNAVSPLQTKVPTTTYTHGSVATYFHDQSLGQYRPRFDIVGPVNLSKSYSYYGAGGGAGSHATEMINEACSLVNGDVDFTQFDSDGDNYIDLVFVLYAGFGQNDEYYIDDEFELDVSNLVWPHYSRNGYGTFDGKKLRAYECSNELDGFFSHPGSLITAGTGVLVHEFSHGMGLPDVYLGGTQYMGSWDLMDYGCYNGDTYIPSAYNGFQRWFCGWSRPILLNSPDDITLRPISQSGDFGLITSDGQLCDSLSTNWHWIVENRQPQGWDEYAHGQGLILYQMKYHNDWGTSTNSGTEGCRLLPADGVLRSGGYVGKQGDCYPYDDLNSILIAPNYPITAIQQEANGDISLKVCGGRQTPTENVEMNPNTQSTSWHKVLRDGVLYIERDGQVYSVMGK